MSDDSPGFFRNLGGLARDYVSQKRKALNSVRPTTNVDKSGGRTGYTFESQAVTHEELREIKRMRESGGTVSQLMQYKALLNFGEGADIRVENNEETEQVVDGEPLTLEEWLASQFPELDQLVLELGEDALWFPYAVGELRKDRAGGFGDFLPAQPWCYVPECNSKGEIIAWEEQTKGGHGQQTRTLGPNELIHLVLNKNSARDTTGISEVLRNQDEIRAYKENEQAIANAIELHGFPQRHIKVGKEDGAPVRDNELRRVRNLFDPSTTDANTAYFTGRDVEINSIESEQFDYREIDEMGMRNLTTALGLPLEMGNVGSDGLGSGKPAELRFSTFKLSIKANQRQFGSELCTKILKPVVDQYSPWDADEHSIHVEIDDPLEDVGEMAELIQSIGDHLTNNEIRRKLDYPEHEDDEIGESYRDPATIEAPEDSGPDNPLFGSDARTLADIPEKYIDGTGLSEGDFVPNESIRDVIAPTLEFIDEHGLPNPDDQQEGAARINQLMDHIENDEPLAPEFWREIRNFHERHRAQDNQRCDESSLPEEATEIDNSKFDKCHYDNGWFSNRTWGGDPAYEQAQRIVSAIEETDGVELAGATPKHFRAGDTDFRNVSQTELAHAEDWEAELIELHQRLWDADGSKQLLQFSPSETPEFVKERIKGSIMDGNIFSDFENVASGDLMQLREYMTETLAESDGWTIDGLADQIMQLPDVDRGNAEVIARTETASVLNSAREDGYEEQGMEDELFYWTGATQVEQPDRTTDACDWLINKTNPFHGGNPVPMEELKELIEEAPTHDPDMQNDLARPENFVVHPNERKTFARYIPGTVE
jgi:hypothetical protein